MRTVLSRPLQHVAFLAAIMVVACILAQGAVARGRQESDALVRQGVAEMQAGRLTEAVPLLDRAIEADPTYELAFVARAELYAQSNKYTDAAKKMEKAIQLRGNVPMFYSKLGEYYRKDKKPDQAIKALEQALKLNANDAAALSSLGQIHHERGNYSKAEKCFKDACDLKKGADLTDLFWLGRTRYELGKKDGNTQKIAEGEADLEKVVAKLEASKQAPFLEATAVLSQIKHDRHMALVKKTALIGVPVILVILGLVLVVSRRRNSGGAAADRMDLDIDSSSPEEISARALKRLCTMTQMAFGVMYATNLEGDELVPTATLGLDPQHLRSLQVDVHETPRWLERNDHKPFLFAAEKKEGVFIKAFPDAREQLEPIEIRIGVPFVHQDRLLGLAFLGIEKSKDILKLKKLYERSTVDLYRVAVEVAGALYRLFENEMAYMDVVTKFSSQKYVQENLPRSLMDAEDAGRKGALVLFEFDQYKELEQQYGESQALKVVRNVADELRLILPPDEGIVARFEGGRFFVYQQVNSLEMAQALATKLHEQVAKARLSRNLPAPTASMGVAVFPDHGRKAADLLWAVEQVMMGVSAAGGNAVAYVEAAAPASGGGVPRRPLSAGGPPSGATAVAPPPTQVSPPLVPQGEPQPGQKLPGVVPPPLPGPPSWVTPSANAPAAPNPAVATPSHVPSWLKGDSGASATPAGIPGFSGGPPPDMAALGAPPTDSFASRSSPFKATTGPVPPPAPMTPPPPPAVPAPAASRFSVPATQMRSGPPQAPPDAEATSPDANSPRRRLLGGPTKGGGKLFARRNDGGSLAMPRGAGDAAPAEGMPEPPPPPPPPPVPASPATAPFAPAGPFAPPTVPGAFPPPPPPFGATPPTVPAFGATPPAPPVFGVQTSSGAALGSTPAPTFGAPPPTPGFGGASSSAPFGAPTVAPFGPAPSASPVAPFGAIPGAPQAQPFGAAPGAPQAQPFGAASAPSLGATPGTLPAPPFGSAPLAPLPPSFGSAPSTAMGAPPPPPPSLGTLPSFASPSAQRFPSPLASPSYTPPGAAPGGRLPSSTLGGPPPASRPVPPRPAHTRTAAMLDSQTGFLQPEHTQRFLQEEVQWSEAAHESCAVIFFQVDQYARLLPAIGPERMGQMQGTIASLIQDFLKEDVDIAGRAGDDSFMIIIPRTSSRIASNLAQQICLTVGNLYVPGLDEKSTISVGIAAYPEHARNAEEVQECARRASLQVKQHGGNGIQVYTPD